MTVPWLLHMSDPHLGKSSPGQLLDDEKEVFEGQPDLQTTQDVFKRTLKTLESFVTMHGKPEAVVVSGDLAYRADESGFAAFVSLLGERGDILPDDRSRIVVYPRRKRSRVVSFDNARLRGRPLFRCSLLECLIGGRFCWAV